MSDLIVAAREDGRRQARKLIGGDKLASGGSYLTAPVLQSQIGNGAVGQAQFKYETAALAFGAADTTKTATVTSGSIVIGVYSSTVTGAPVYGELQLGVSGTTLTGTRSAAPGGTAAITYTVILLKT